MNDSFAGDGAAMNVRARDISAHFSTELFFLSIWREPLTAHGRHDTFTRGTPERELGFETEFY